jgi:hypothetical protein
MPVRFLAAPLRGMTPRTDAEVRMGEYGQPYEIVDAEFARQLERELEQYKAIKELMSVEGRTGTAMDGWVA